MATIRKTPAGNWEAIIRRKGRKPKSRTFSKIAVARRWARDEESALEVLAVTPVADRVLLSEVIKKYIEQFTPRKRAPV